MRLFMTCADDSEVCLRRWVRKGCESILSCHRCEGRGSRWHARAMDEHNTHTIARALPSPRCTRQTWPPPQPPRPGGSRWAAPPTLLHCPHLRRLPRCCLLRLREGLCAGTWVCALPTADGAMGNAGSRCVCMHACMYACVHPCMRACTHACTSDCGRVHAWRESLTLRSRARARAVPAGVLLGAGAHAPRRAGRSMGAAAGARLWHRPRVCGMREARGQGEEQHQMISDDRTKADPNASSMNVVFSQHVLVKSTILRE